jgi:hypothetical protein
LGIVILGIAAWSAWPDTPLPSNAKVDLVVVQKAARRLELYRGDQLVKAYAVSLGRHPSDKKQALEESFRNVRIDVIGCFAQFSGRA